MVAPARPAGTVIRNSGWSSPLTPPISVACCHTSSAGAERRVEDIEGVHRHRFPLCVHVAVHVAPVTVPGECGRVPAVPESTGTAGRSPRSAMPISRTHHRKPKLSTSGRPAMEAHRSERIRHRGHHPDHPTTQVRRGPGLHHGVVDRADRAVHQADDGRQGQNQRQRRQQRDDHTGAAEGEYRGHSRCPRRLANFDSTVQLSAPIRPPIDSAINTQPSWAGSLRSVKYLGRARFPSAGGSTAPSPPGR